MRANSLFAIYRTRLYKFFLKNQGAILHTSYLTILFGLLFISFNRLFVFSASNKQFTTGVIGFWFFIFTAIGTANFLIAYFVVGQREKQIDDLKKLVLIDQLTGIYNKGYFLTKLQTEIVRSRRYKRFLSLILIDIDHFKKLNDTYGHICGDMVLRSVAKLLKTEVRFVDIACRFGGEEFAIICPETGVHEAATLAERIRKKIETTKFTYSQDEIYMTVSIGINKFDPLKPETDYTLFRGADQALYHAKHSGRNQVVTYSQKFKDFPSKFELKAEEEKKEQKETRQKIKKVYFTFRRWEGRIFINSRYFATVRRAILIP